ncbi:MAG: dCMP deaminase [Maribacter sp.]
MWEGSKPRTLEVYAAIEAIGMKKSKQEKYDKAYLRMAQEWGKLSYCERKQVGAIIVKGRMIISDGYNGTPTGFENFCEDEEGYTKWYVLHAEANAILKVAGSTQSCQDATLYITLSPCKECSKLIHQSGINRVVYQKGYKDNSGLEFLEKAGVELVHMPTIDT